MLQQGGEDKHKNRDGSGISVGGGVFTGWAPPWNPFFHCLVLEGGFDENGRFLHIPPGNVHRMSEYFRRVIIKFFLKKQLISAKIATSLINWRHSGSSVNASVHIPAGSSKTREALSQYISRPPLSLKKISI
ncbi:MAG: transposase, partial [Spirochaetaceae bacterium]